METSRIEEIKNHNAINNAHCGETLSNEVYSDTKSEITKADVNESAHERELVPSLANKTSASGTRAGTSSCFRNTSMSMIDSMMNISLEGKIDKGTKVSIGGDMFPVLSYDMVNLTRHHICNISCGHIRNCPHQQILSRWQAEAEPLLAKESQYDVVPKAFNSMGGGDQSQIITIDDLMMSGNGGVMRDRFGESSHSLLEDLYDSQKSRYENLVEINDDQREEYNYSRANLNFNGKSKRGKIYKICDEISMHLRKCTSRKNRTRVNAEAALYLMEKYSSSVETKLHITGISRDYSNTTLSGGHGIGHSI